MYQNTSETKPLLNQIKKDFSNARNRVIVAQVMKANGYSKTEIMAELDNMQTSDLADLILSQIDG